VLKVGRLGFGSLAESSQNTLGQQVRLLLCPCARHLSVAAQRIKKQSVDYSIRQRK